MLQCFPIDNKSGLEGSNVAGVAIGSWIRCSVTSHTGEVDTTVRARGAEQVFDINPCGTVVEICQIGKTM